MLDVGADPRHLEGDLSILDYSWYAHGKVEVARLLLDHGWDVTNMEIRITSQLI